MVDNASKMTVSERLAQRIKQSELGTLLDEDDVTDIARTAIERAFFETQKRTDGYRTFESPPAIVEMAQACFKPIMEEMARKVVTRLANGEDFRNQLAMHVMQVLPAVLSGQARQILNQSFAQSAQHSTAVLEEALKRHLSVEHLGFYPFNPPPADPDSKIPE